MCVGDRGGVCVCMCPGPRLWSRAALPPTLGYSQGREWEGRVGREAVSQRAAAERAPPEQPPTPPQREESYISPALYSHSNKLYYVESVVLKTAEIALRRKPLKKVCG